MMRSNSEPVKQAEKTVIEAGYVLYKVESLEVTKRLRLEPNVTHGHSVRFVRMPECLCGTLNHLYRVALAADDIAQVDIFPSSQCSSPTLGIRCYPVGRFLSGK